MTHADREALVDRPTGRRWTYAELHHDVLALAHGLIRLGIDKGDRVGIWAPNCPEWTVLQYATAEIGAILVPINPAPAFDPVATLAAVAEERCTSLYGVPAMFIAELAQPGFDAYDLSSLRTGAMDGAPCPVEVMKQVMDRWVGSSRTSR